MRGLHTHKPSCGAQRRSLVSSTVAARLLGLSSKNLLVSAPPVLALQTRQGTTVYPRLVSAPSVGITDSTGHHSVSPTDLELSGITRLYLPSAEMKGAHHKPDPQNPFLMKPSLHPPDVSPDPFLQYNGESLPHLTSLTCSCKGLGSVRSTP